MRAGLAEVNLGHQLLRRSLDHAQPRLTVPVPTASPDELAAAADDNLVVHASWATAQLPGARVALAPDLVMVDSGLSCDTFNLVCRARLSPEAASGRIRDALTFFAASGHAFSWWLGPGSTPTDLPGRLTEAGLQATETEEAMVLSLAELTPDPRVPEGLEVRQIASLDDLNRFAALSAANWSPPDSLVVRYYQLTASLLLTPEAPQRLYLGLLDRQPVATAEVTFSGDTAGLYNISTAPASRHRGIGTAMTHLALRHARQAGCRHAVLQAAGSAASPYARLGFRSFGSITEFKPGG